MELLDSRNCQYKYFYPERIYRFIELKEPEENVTRLLDDADRFFATSSWGRWSQIEERCDGYSRFFRRGAWKNSVLGEPKPAGFCDYTIYLDQYTWLKTGIERRVAEEPKELAQLWSLEAAVLFEPRKHFTCLHFEALIFINGIYETNDFLLDSIRLFVRNWFGGEEKHRELVAIRNLLQETAIARVNREADELFQYLSAEMTVAASQKSVLCSSDLDENGRSMVRQSDYKNS